ncbi:MAG TPA: addiction module protein [Longimicrobiaceae bacterium]
MSTRAEQLKSAALKLSLDERLEILQTLLDSLGDDPGVDPECYAEILRRAEEVRSGTAEMIPGDEVMRELDEYIRSGELSAPEVGSLPDDGVTDAKVAAAWDEEAERRHQAYLRGEIEALDAEVAMVDLRKRFGNPGQR